MSTAVTQLPLKRSMLKSVKRGVIKVADRILIHGGPGVGKTTFAAGFPDPVFLEAGDSDGTARIDTARTRAESWGDVLDMVDELTTSEHGYKTFVIDTLDGVEPLLWSAICKRDGKANIEAYGFGKGYVAAIDEWRAFLSKLERLRAERGMTIVFIAHTKVRPFNNPEGDNYDRYEMKLHASASALLSEWCDAILFARFKTFVATTENGRSKGVSNGARILNTVRTAAYEAKNRYGLPTELPLDYASFAAAVEKGAPRDAAEVKASIAEMLAQLPDIAEKVNPLLAAAGDNATELLKIENRLKATLAQRQKEST